MRALVRVNFGEDKIPDCTRCEGDGRLRALYGCDAPAESRVFGVTCSGCLGKGCERCHDGDKAMHRCPSKCLESHPSGPHIAQSFKLCVAYERSAVLPTMGGLADQSASWVEMLNAYEHERGVIEREKRAAEERKRKSEMRAPRRG